MMALLRMACALAAALVLAAPAAAASDWKTREVEGAGFSMLVPGDAVSEAAPEGWVGINIKHKGIILAGLAREGAKAEEMEAALGRIARMLPESIEIDDEGKGDGWKWFKAVYASESGRVMLGIYGESAAKGGAKGYIFLLLTTEDDFDSNEDLYYDWFESIQIY